ncbi:MAG: hypothetical protein IJD92_01675 [Bacilli bacterium]|nr:hypothetical protein [Bacilli bacterium]
METIKLEEKYILEYIKDILNDCKEKNREVTDYRFHHGTEYKIAPSIIKYGILTIEDLNKLGLRNDSKSELERLGDIDSHANGTYAVSLSDPLVDDLYPGEEKFDTFSNSRVDFLLSNSIQAGRSTINWGNEYLSYKSIPSDKIKSVDIRLIDLFEKLKTNKYLSLEESINNFNELKNIAMALKTTKLDIPIREMSKENEIITLNKEKVIELPKLILK